MGDWRPSLRAARVGEVHLRGAEVGFDDLIRWRSRSRWSWRHWRAYGESALISTIAISGNCIRIGDTDLEVKVAKAKLRRWR